MKRSSSRQFIALMMLFCFPNAGFCLPGMDGSAPTSWQAPNTANSIPPPVNVHQQSNADAQPLPSVRPSADVSSLSNFYSQHGQELFKEGNIRYAISKFIMAVLLDGNNAIPGNSTF